MVRTLIEELNKYEKAMADALMQVVETKQKLLEEYGMSNVDNSLTESSVNIPFAAYETQLERFQEEKRELQDRYDREKESMRKHYRNLVKWISIAFATFVLCVFGTLFYFLTNYDFMSFNQDAEGINNYAYNTTQGDVMYESTDKTDKT